MENILLILLGLAIIVIIALAITAPKIVVISDDKPENPTPKNNWLKLQNEGKKYIKESNGKIYLKIVK